MSSKTSCLKRKRVAEEELVEEPKRMATRRKRLPAELLCELIKFIPIMYLFAGINRCIVKKMPASCLGPINWMFDSFRSDRQKQYADLKQILLKFGAFSEVRKLVGGGTCAMHHLGDEISDELFGHELVQYLCYGRSGRTNVVISTPAINSTAIGKLCGRLIEFVVASPNTLSVKRRICLGLIFRQHLPCIMQQPAGTMARRGFFPTVRSNGQEVYHLYNAQMKKIVGYIKINPHTDQCEHLFFILYML